MQRQPVLVSAVSTSDFHTLCKLGWAFEMLLKQLWILGWLAWWGFFGLVWGLVFFPAAYLRPRMFFNFSFAPDANTMILISCSPISLLWRGRGFYLQEVAIFLAVESAPWFTLRPSGTTWLLGSNIPVFFLPSLPVPMCSTGGVRTGL